MTESFIPAPEPAMDCSLRFRFPDKSRRQCPNTAVFDVITQCDRGHVDTKYLCDDKCMTLALSDGVSCRECKDDGIEPNECPTHVLTFWRRGPIIDEGVE